MIHGLKDGTTGSESLLSREEINALLVALKQRMVRDLAAERQTKTTGFRIAPIEAGSIFSELGLQSSDVIVGVNGASITTPDQAALLLQSIKAGGNVTIQVKGKRCNRIIQLDIS